MVDDDTPESRAPVHDSVIDKQLGYPFTQKMEIPEDCVEAIDWIIKNVADLYGDPSIQVHKWYDFIWTKTWAICKDVLRLRLNDLEGVGIVERCARFHIFSAHALAEFSEPRFVAKYNFEQIQRCLATLKHLYKDLNMRGIHCVNEAEFLSYFLLHFPRSYLDFNDFPLTIRRSKPIQFALKFLSILQNGNYIAFFDLVREATYLQACILHRYFKQMRERALQTICKAYVPSMTNPIKISVNELNSLLAFEDDEERESYLQCAGITYDSTNVTFSKAYNYGRIFNPEIRCSYKLVECLRQYKLVSDIITGGEGPLLTSYLETNFPKPKLKVMETDQLVAKNSVTEAIWKSIFISLINNMVTEAFMRLRYPYGKPEYEYDDQSTLGSVSELDGTQNESDAEIIFEEINKEEATQVREQIQLQEIRSKVQEAVELEGAVAVSVSATESILVESRIASPLKPKQDLEQEPISVLTPIPEPEPKPEPETETSSHIHPQLLKLMKMQRERALQKEKERQEALEASTKTESPQIESQITPEPELAVYEGETEAHQDGAQAASELDDSELIVSDEDEPKKEKEETKRMMNITATSILRAITKYHKEHGEESL